MQFIDGTLGIVLLLVIFIGFGELFKHFLPQVGRKRGYSLSGYITTIIGAYLLNLSDILPAIISYNLTLLIVAISLTGILTIAISRKNPQIYLTLFSSPIRFLTELGIVSGIVTISLYVVFYV